MVDALILAGGQLGEGEPLGAAAMGRPKALMPVAGRPMVDWVIHALDRSCQVRHIVLAGLPEHQIPLEHARLHCIPDAGSMLANIEAGRRALRRVSEAPGRALLCMGDIPLLTPDGVRRYLNACGPQDRDFYYTVVKEGVLEQQFPGSSRTYIELADGRFAGGDLFLTHVDFNYDRALIQSLIDGRKNVVKVAWRLGARFWIKAMKRRLSTHDVAERLGTIMGLQAQVIHSDDGALAMDVDRLENLRRVEAELFKREGMK